MFAEDRFPKITHNLGQSWNHVHTEKWKINDTSPTLNCLIPLSAWNNARRQTASPCRKTWRPSSCPASSSILTWHSHPGGKMPPLETKWLAIFEGWAILSCNGGSFTQKSRVVCGGILPLDGGSLTCINVGAIYHGGTFTHLNGGVILSPDGGSLTWKATKVQRAFHNGKEAVCHLLLLCHAQKAGKLQCTHLMLAQMDVHGAVENNSLETPVGSVWGPRH